ncbi:M48 family metallopeptidase [Marivivens aquimaris]|uniref:M48 family metallopeptidase n=1 Tax=Marivivens aquimaris TaxID=2774876 RepID=UPI00187EC5A0|nr:SprT family zinc-dependent metalloprotease [Marivivens aquimaris]
MGPHSLPGNPPIAITLRRSTRARRISLRISRVDGRVTLTIPKKVSEAEGMAFAREREEWLRGHLSEMSGVNVVGIGSKVPVRGILREVTAGQGRSIAMNDSQLIVPGDPARAGVRVQAMLKTMARDALAEASDRYAAKVGKQYNKITLRDTRSRWGSCTSRKDLMYSWRLIMAPAEVLEYVAAHEVAHLVEMNHSDAFWNVVEGIYPDYRKVRHWLRVNGQDLHSYRFTD